MLVLSRKRGQELVIGENIRITVNRVSGNRVTLGIEAPEGVSVMRSELLQVIHAFADTDANELTQDAADEDGSVLELEAVFSEPAVAGGLEAWRQAHR